MFKKIIFSVAITFALFLAVAPALAYISPGKPAGPVNDYAHVMSATTSADITRLLTDYEKSSGNSVVVATVPSLGDEVIETYAVKLFQEWGVGGAKQDNGILLLVAPNEKAVRIEVGYGLEGDVTDLESSRIISQVILPAFKNNDLNTGISEGTKAIVAAIKGDWFGPGSVTEETATSTNVQEISLPVAFAIILFAIVIFVLIFIAFKKGKPGSGSSSSHGGSFFSGGSSGGSSFGGFGGGSSGGGGASGKW